MQCASLTKAQATNNQLNRWQYRRRFLFCLDESRLEHSCLPESAF
ncbi:hypothetical protein HMPREF6745_2643 [Prevotella sp. oral taxon 472 str. F0295]|nr:hypothetical protein HMPREF6745_2643 [Prevotella sp. oral taxon 472 str. F0295]